MPTSGVEVATDKSDYQVGESIVVTITNPLSDAIYALTGQSYCTIVSAQRLVNDEWQLAGTCAAATPPEYLEIAPHSETVVKLAPQLAVDQALAGGEYRIRFIYRTGSRDGPDATAFSSPFTISEQAPPTQVISGSATIETPVPVTPTLVVTPSISITPTPTIESPKSTQSEPVETGVTVATDKIDYQPGENVVVTVSNHLTTAIFALTGQSYCTIVSAQRNVNDSFQQEGTCAAVPPQYIEIAPDSESVIELHPRLPADQELPPGDYRIQFIYRVGSREGIDHTIFSQSFLVGSSVQTCFRHIFLTYIDR
jgi:hypothetical protein